MSDVLIRNSINCICLLHGVTFVWDTSLSLYTHTHSLSLSHLPSLKIAHLARGAAQLPAAHTLSRTALHSRSTPVCAAPLSALRPEPKEEARGINPSISCRDYIAHACLECLPLPRQSIL